MKKAEKKFRIYAILVIFVLVTVLLAVINGVNFTMAAADADELTATLANGRGAFQGAGNDPGAEPREEQAPRELQDPREGQTPREGQIPFGEQGRTGGKDFRMGPMGPGSPEMNASLRYFTMAFPENGGAPEIVAFNVSAVTEAEAADWAESLLNEKTGWTRGTYRYRVYKDRGMTYVTVIDQGRELLPSFRILIISAVGEALILVIGWFVLLWIGRRIYAPIEEADRKQKNFIRNVNREFRVPLTVINGNTELTERQYGPDERTRSTRRQVAKMNDLVNKLGSAGVFGDEPENRTGVPLSEFFNASLDLKEKDFASRGVALTREIEQDVSMSADPGAVERMTGELVENALKYSLTKVSFTLKKENGYVIIETENDAELPDGPVNQVFDRFTTLGNAVDGSAGLGLSAVGDTVKALGGRASASVKDGIFALRITL